MQKVSTTIGVVNSVLKHLKQFQFVNYKKVNLLEMCIVGSFEEGNHGRCKRGGG